MKKYIFVLFFIFFLNFINVDALDKRNLVNIYFFHSDTCSYCKEEEKLLDGLEERYDNIRIYEYEIRDKENYDLLMMIQELYGVNVRGVPLTIIGDKVYSGFSIDKSTLKFIKTIEYFSKYGYEDKIGEYLGKDLVVGDKDADMSLNNFIDTYKNYELFGFDTDDLSITSIAILLGIRDVFDIFSIIGVALMMFLISSEKSLRDKLIFIGYYLLIRYLVGINSLVGNIYLSVFMYCLLLFLLVFNLKKRNKKRYFVVNMFFVIFLSINCFYENKNVFIFRDIMSLYDLNGINLVVYYTYYIVISLLISIIFIYMVDMVINRIKCRKQED